MLNQPFFQVALPIMSTLVVAIWLTSWSQNKRLDDIVARLMRVENLLRQAQGPLPYDLQRLYDRIKAPYDSRESGNES